MIDLGIQGFTALGGYTRVTGFRARGFCSRSRAAGSLGLRSIGVEAV